MEKYFNLLSNVANQLTKKAAQRVAIVVDLERIQCIINDAERKIETAGKTV